jgi:hypothetical protein
MNPTRTHFVPALIALLTLLVAAPAVATTMVRLDLSELTWIADVVVQGEVVASQAERMPGQQYLQTATRVRAVQVLKGHVSEGDVIDVVEPGGRLGDEETRIPSGVVFAPGERVLLFLERRGGELVCVGMDQGKLTLVAEAHTARDALVRVTPPRGLASFDETEVRLPARRLYLDDVQERIRQELDMGFVPSYRSVPGLPAAKDARFRSEAQAAGKLDPRWIGGER